MKKDFLLMIGDFETTVYDGQERTDVWCASLVPLYSNEPVVLTSINEFFDYLECLPNKNIKIFFHNLKFDGSFILNYLFSIGYKNAVQTDNTEYIDCDLFQIKKREFKFYDDKWMLPKTLKYVISDMGRWYSITIRTKKKFIVIQDSLKLLPFSVKRIGTSFNTKHKKLDIEYTGYRKPGGVIAPNEQEYIKNDVLVPKEAIELMLEEGHNKSTIGSCCLDEFKNIFCADCITHKEAKEKWDYYFPDLTQVLLDKEVFGASNADEYIRNSYRGGWCYLAKGKVSKNYKDGLTLDVNSLYPSVMHSQSGSFYPYGYPEFFQCCLPPELENRKYGSYYYYVRIRCAFELKEGYLPYIQIKRNLLYDSREMLRTSNIYDKNTGKYYNVDENGNRIKVTLTLSMFDFEIIKEHYHLYDLEILDGCVFNAARGFFDEYINKYMEIKMNSTGAKRELAKLFLNNLYGKFATNKNSSFKVCHLEDGVLKFETVIEFEKRTGYIPIGAAITAYARRFTITAAQKNYYGDNKRGFIYSDTDSIHCDLKESELIDIPIDSKKLCYWKVESHWTEGYFIRPKTYVERVNEKGKLKYDIKCAGMPDHCKNLFLLSMGEEIDDKEKFISKLDDEELAFINHRRTLSDFNIGLSVPGKLIGKQIKGGMLLSKTTYEMLE